jgi:hypothetical protein
LSNAVLILQKSDNKAILYRSALVSGTNYKFTRTETAWSATLALSNFSNNVIPMQPLNNSMSTNVWFGGYGPNKIARTQQPFCEIYLIGETYNYASQQSTARAKFHLRTMIESRDYNSK